MAKPTKQEVDQLKQQPLDENELDKVTGGKQYPTYDLKYESLGTDGDPDATTNR